MTSEKETANKRLKMENELFKSIEFFSSFQSTNSMFGTKYLIKYNVSARKYRI